MQKNRTKNNLLFLDEPIDRATIRPHDKPDTQNDMKVPYGASQIVVVTMKDMMVMEIHHFSRMSHNRSIVPVDWFSIGSWMSYEMRPPFLAMTRCLI